MSVVIGIDMGTSGARTIALENDAIVGQASFPIDGDMRNPLTWRRALHQSLDATLTKIDRKKVRAIAIDGTSGTMLAVDDEGNPLSSGIMYNDPSSDSTVLARIAQYAPETSAVHGASSGLARFLKLQDMGSKVLHQADWLAFEFSGRFFSDENNALKTGYDPVHMEWPKWMEETGVDMVKLPRVYPAATAVCTISKESAEKWGLSIDVIISSGTTDGCASFLATGANQNGGGVTALGSTMTIKFLSESPIFAPQYGVYSHKILGNWLAGGASNSGGAALLNHFSLEEINTLSPLIDGRSPSEYSYYPLAQTGERFPRNDPNLEPIITPVPATRAEYLKGFFDGMASIEEEAYALLSGLSGQKLRSVRSVGGGATNNSWQQLRQNRLKVPFLPANSVDAAFGTALLAQNALNNV